MNFSLLSPFSYFYQFLIYNIEKYSIDISKTEEETITLLKGYDRELTSMCLDNESIKSLPYEILEFAKPKRLFLNNNQFTEIPSALFEMKVLGLLDMCKNRLKDFPNKILLKNLKVFI